MKRKRASTLLVASAIAVAAIAYASPGRAEEAKPDHTVKDPHYGDALFHFFQDRYFTAVTTLMASQQFRRVSHHDDEAEVLRGGMLLSYGMTKEAGDIFARLIERGAPPSVRDRAWFYLAKIRYQRGEEAGAGEALAKVEKKLPGTLEEGRVLLAAQLLMAGGDYAGAARTLAAHDATASSKAPGLRYLRFNLGVALVKSGDAARGTPLLDTLGQQYAENEEYRSLRDRANLALGFTALAENRPKEARTYLERVRLQSLSANKALLGFGWAADALKEPKLALVPWLELAGRDADDSAVLEAQIAVPYAYAELGAYSESMQRYEGAIAAFTREKQSLAESIAAIRKGTLVDALVESNPGDEMGWFWDIRNLPPGMPHARHLAQVLAGHDFQEALKNYRDLRFLAKNLDDWNDKLGTFGDMLNARRKAFADHLPPVQGRPWQARLAELKTRRDVLDADAKAGEQAADGIAFADTKERALMATIEAAKATVERLAALPAGGAASSPGATAGDAASTGLDADTRAELDRARERLRLASGALTWNLAQSLPDRAWQSQKERKAIDNELASADRRDAALAAAQESEPKRFDAFAQRIAALSPHIAALSPVVVALGREQKAAAQQIAIAELEGQQQRLAGYETQARFALAQLYDRAYAKR